MPPAFYALLSMLGVLFRSQLSLRPESFAPRDQLANLPAHRQATDHSARRPHPLVLAIALPGKVARCARL